ncbi:MAG: F0F1 ATP synthase subunit B [Pirellulales bacterium]|nr:F0F1 ATP synthase subunit B [Pirellulales bacterium]
MTKRAWDCVLSHWTFASLAMVLWIVAFCPGFAGLAAGAEDPAASTPAASTPAAEATDNHSKTEKSDVAGHGGDAKHSTGHTAGGHDDHAHPGHKGMGQAQAVDWRSDLAIYSFVVFLLLMAVLTKFAWGPISQALDQREESIADNIASAQRAAAEAKSMLGEYEAKLANAADQVRAMLEEARRDAETTKGEIINEAKVAAQQEHDRALRDIRTATDGAMKQLAEKSADLATELAGKMLRAQMNKADHSRLVQESLAQFVAGSASNN